MELERCERGRKMVGDELRMNRARAGGMSIEPDSKVFGFCSE